MHVSNLPRSPLFAGIPEVGTVNTLTFRYRFGVTGSHVVGLAMPLVGMRYGGKELTWQTNLSVVSVWDCVGYRSGLVKEKGEKGKEEEGQEH